MENRTLITVLWLTAAYLIGGVPFGYIIGRMRGVDVRTVGSKNIGATNVFRTVGKKWGLLAFACDVLKGLLPVLAAKWYLSTFAYPVMVHLPLQVGIMCVIGHMLTPYMNFRGGKGVATAFGMLLGLIPGLVGCAFLVFVALFALSNYISLGSCGAAAFLAVTVWIPFARLPGYHDLPLCVFVTFIALFIIWKHRSNIGRLVHGTENRIYLFKRAKGPDEAK